MPQEKTDIRMTIDQLLRTVQKANRAYAEAMSLYNHADRLREAIAASQKSTSKKTPRARSTRNR